MLYGSLIICGMLIPLTYIFMYLFGGAIRPEYSHISDSVSELLTPNAPNKTILTIVQIIYAFLHILFGVGVLFFVMENEEEFLTGFFGASVIVGVGVVTVGTAIFSQDPKGATETRSGKIHKILVFGFLIPFSFISTILIGLWTQQTGISFGFSIYSYVTVAFIIISGIVGGITVEKPYAGLVERISALIVHQWLFVLALMILLF